MKYSCMYVYTRMIFAAVLSPAIKIFHRHLGPKSRDIYIVVLLYKSLSNPNISIGLYRCYFFLITCVLSMYGCVYFYVVHTLNSVTKKSKLSPAIKIFHRHLGPNLLIFTVKVSPWFHRHFTVILWHITPLPEGGGGVYCFTSVRPSVRPRSFSSHFSQ
jgi:hypothetical protein